MRAYITSIIVALFLFAATAPVGSATQLSTSTVVGNALPIVQDVAVTSSVDPTAGGTTQVPLTITVSDSNGFQDIASVSVAVYKPDGTTIHVGATSATSNEDGSGVSASYAHSFGMLYYDAPAVGNDTYKVRVTAQDANGALSSTFETGFSYTELVAMSVDAADLDFGAADPGTRSSVAGLSLTNEGNTVIDLDTAGSGLSDGDGHAITVDRIKYDLGASDMANESALTSDPYTNTGLDLAYGPEMTHGTWWQLDVPSGEEQYLPAGSYSGTVTLGAVQG